MYDAPNLKLFSPPTSRYELRERLADFVGVVDPEQRVGTRPVAERQHAQRRRQSGQRDTVLHFSCMIMLMPHWSRRL